VFVTHAQIINTFAGTGNFGYSGDGGPALLADITAPTGIVTDKKGNVYFCEWYFGLIRKVDPNGIITKVAGGGSTMSDLADSIPATTALVRHPWGLTIDSTGNLYFAEAQFNQVRKIDTTGIITTIAGAANMTGSFSGDGGVAKSAGLNLPSDVAIDKYGNIYIADGNNHCIRMVNPSGIITTIAGSSNGFSGDGGLAVNAKFSYPLGIATDHLNNIFIGDAGNRRIRKINNSTGYISTIVGTGVQANSGDGGLATNAEMGSTRGLEVDTLGNLYFADREFGVVRKVDNSGFISTLAGTGTGGGYSGDGGPATNAQLYSPIDATFDKTGNLYITDNLRVRIVCYNSCATNLNEFNKSSVATVYPNPATNNLQILDNQSVFKNTQLEIINNLGQITLSQIFESTIDITPLPSGIYTLRITTTNKESFYSKFIKE
jgi:sugar lactone lactonase YvrE